MSFRGVEFAVAASLAAQAATMAQAQPPVPSDPLELVSGDAQPVQNAEQRAAATHLLTKAHTLSNVHAYPYDLKTIFVSSGVSSGASEGSWSLEDTSPSRDVYRCTAQGPSYSAINLHSNQLVYSNRAGDMPLRLAQVRAAICFVSPAAGPHASLRTAAAVGTKLNTASIPSPVC